MDARKGNIYEILNGNKQFLIPVYQRYYSWDVEQCKRLWNDIVEMQKKGKQGHFVGSIVNIAEQAMPTGVQKYMIIDGQQRMTKATVIIQHITYNVLDEHYDTDIFTEPTIKGKLGTNAMKAQRHLYDHIVYDSTNERDFATDLDTNTDVAVYVKLPDSFYIATPVGHYNPDWAIAFYEGTVKHIYFVAETKGSMSSMQLRLIEESKIHCAREHFKAISSGNVVYDVVDSYQTLLERVMK